MLKLIAYSLKVVHFSEISKGIRRCNITSLLILFRVLINTGKYLEVIF